jgi:hypothetical protein
LNICQSIAAASVGGYAKYAAWSNGMTVQNGLNHPSRNTLHDPKINMNINIKVIPESEQRETVNGADWFFDDQGDLQVRVSPMSDWRYEVALAFHEAFEACLCKNNGVTQKSVDDFDMAYDLAHPDQPDINAGDEPDAPYVREHNYATIVDRLFIGACGLFWKKYDDELATVYPGPTKK